MCAHQAGPNTLNNNIAGINTRKLPAGYKIPKKTKTATTPPDIEDGEVLSSDDENKPEVASIIVNTKRVKEKDLSPSWSDPLDY